MGHPGPRHDHKPKHVHRDWLCGYHLKDEGQQRHHYDEWWEKEGKASFETYFKARQKEEEADE